MSRQYLTPANSAIVLIDHAIGFANFRSTDPATHINNAVALAKTAKLFDVPLVVTNGADQSPPGPLFPQLKQVLGDHPVVVRESAPFDAFEEDAVRDAIEATGRRRLILAGLNTEGCLLHTALTAQAEGYETYVVVDASAGETKEVHDLAVQRMVQAGIVPTSWLSLASEYQRRWTNFETVAGFAELIAHHSTPLSMHMQVVQNFQASAPAPA